jgi:hypothetical protein
MGKKEKIITALITLLGSFVIIDAIGWKEMLPTIGMAIGIVVFPMAIIRFFMKKNPE